MPQVSTKDFRWLKSFLTRMGVKYEECNIPAESLKPTQSEFNLSKVDSLIREYDKIKDKTILVSKDNRVIDGHHRWLAAKKLGVDIPVIKINKRYDNVLGVLTSFSKTFSKGINESKDV